VVTNEIFCLLTHGEHAKYTPKGSKPFFNYCVLLKNIKEGKYKL